MRRAKKARPAPKVSPPMYRTSLLGSLVLVAALTACGDDSGAPTTTSGAGGSGGESGAGGDPSGTTTTTSASTSSTTQTATSAGGGGSGGETGTGGAGGQPGTGGAGGEAGTGGSGGETGTGGAGGQPGTGGAGGTGGAPACGSPAECAAEWEQNASDHYDELVGGNVGDLADFLFAVPKGGDLHNHLTGAVYAETFLDWARSEGGWCIDANNKAIQSGSCSGANDPVPPPNDPFFDQIVRAWSMKDFVPGAETGHDHFFATFGKFGSLAGLHRNENLADIATRAASENQVYVETMFNLGKNIGELTDDNWSGTLNADDLQEAYDLALNDSQFDTELQKDINVVNTARTQYRTELGCSGGNQPAACDVGMRFIAQVSRTGARATIFGQLISAFEMAAQTPWIVGVNLSSPEDDSTSINAYALHMQMLDFLYERYAETGMSPLHITLHAGELTADYAPPAALLFHIRDAVLIGHAERIGHGLDILGENNAADTLQQMRDRNVLVETCLSSNTQILDVDGANHPLAAYIENEVPVALGTDDQGVSRSSMAGEYLRAALDQEVSYRQLKRMARDSLEHAFLPGDSLWDSIADVEAVGDCAPTDSMGLGQTPNDACADFLAESERAQAQWELERRFRVFESQQ